MTDESPHYSILSGIATSVSEDKTTALLVFATQDGGKVALSFPLRGMQTLRAMANDVITRAGHDAGNPHFKRPKVFQVGHTDQIRNHIAVWFDPNTPHQDAYLIGDQDALKLCQSIGNDIGTRNAALTMPGRRLILPGGRA